MPSGQLKGRRILHLKLFKALENVLFSVRHEQSRNNGKDFQKGKNTGNKTVKTPLLSNTYFLLINETSFYFININIFHFSNITNWNQTLHYCLPGMLTCY